MVLSPARKKAIYKWRQTHPDRWKSYCDKRNKMIKLKALQKVSGLEVPICVNCGCDIVRILEFNHLNGGGINDPLMRNLANNIIIGKRLINDLDVRCRVCNMLYDVEFRLGFIGKYSVTFKK